MRHSFPGGQNAIYGEYNGAIGSTRNYLSIFSDGTVFFDQALPSGGWLPSSAPLNTGQWYHVAYVQDGTTRSLYINGVLDASDNNIENYSGNTPNAVWIGARLNNPNQLSSAFDGNIDELRFWNRALCEDEINDQMNCELSGTETGLVAYYQFNEGDDGGNNIGITDLPDVTGNGHDGTLNNFILTGTSSNWIAPGGVTTGTSCAPYADNTPPSITCPADVTASSDTGTCEATGISLGNASASDDCGTPIVSNNAPNAFPVGTTIVTWTALDGAGNSANCTQQVTVNDGEEPVISCPANIIQNTDSGDCAAFVSVSQPVVSDNCADIQLGNALDFDGTDDYVDIGSLNGEVLGSGSRTIEAWVKMTSTGRLPIFRYGAESIYNRCGLRVFDGDIEVDIYGSQIRWEANINDGQWHHVAWSYSAGNQLQQSVVYLDGVLLTTIINNINGSTIPNTLSGPVTIGQTSNVFYFNGAIDELRIWDKAKSAIEINNDKDSELTGTESNLIAYYKFNNGIAGGNNAGVTSLTDESGNGNNGSLFNLTLNGSLSNWVEGVDLSVPVIIVNDFNGTDDASDTYPTGTSTITWMATDASGNTSTCAQDITVEDNEDPTITCPADITVSTDAGVCEANVSLSLPATSDNCAGEVTSNDAPASFPIGTTTVTWTVTDASGNTAICTQMVTVEDNEAPVAVCQDITIQLDATGNVTITLPQIDNGSNDNCTINANLTLSLDIIAFDCSNAGANTVTLTATDEAGNSSMCTATVTVEDVDDPTITCPTSVSRSFGRCKL